MNKRPSARTSTVALKYAMAVSGLIMVGYLLLHMYGNLKAFAGPGSFNEYADHLRTIGTPILPEKGLLWIVRVVLLVAVLLHAYAGITLWRRNKKAAGYVGAKRYQTKQNKAGVQRSYASFTMRWGGVTLGLFIIYHLLHLTTNTITPGGASSSSYQRLVNGFQIWWVTLFYALAVIALGFHIRHGFWSAFATLGANTSARRRRNLNTVAVAIALVITLGFLAPPLSILFGWIGQK